MELGRQKKLWSLEIMYNVHLPTGGQETKIEWKRNLDTTELMKFREAMFRYGFSMPVTANHWKLVCPMDIISVDLYRQDAYVAENYIMSVNPTQPIG